MSGGQRATDDELRELVGAYAVAADAGDGAAFRDLFHADARLTTWPPDGSPGTPHYGAEAIAHIPATLAGRYEASEHRLGDLHFVVADDGAAALGRVECESHHRVGGVDRVLTIRYDDCYRRGADGRWRFATRDVRVLSVHERPTPASS